jgi:hypothetical protein
VIDKSVQRDCGVAGFAAGLVRQRGGSFMQAPGLRE